MLEIAVEYDAVRIGERFSVTFQRTLRIPDDGRTYPLPPGLGRLPVYRVDEFAGQLPAVWREHGGIFIPLYQREALWLGFSGASWKPSAVQVAVGGLNAVTGTSWAEGLSGDPQNYLVCPPQPWLDGINAGEGFVRQFVAMPLGMGYTIEAQLTGQEGFGGIQIRVYEPKHGRFPDQPPPAAADATAARRMASPITAEPMGLGAGGKIRQRIYPDPHGVETWDPSAFGAVCVHIVNSAQYYAVTGRQPPPTPINAKTYTDYGFPWFELYDEARGDVAAGERFTEVRTVRELDAAQSGRAGEVDEESVNIDPAQVKKLTDSKREEVT